MAALAAVAALCVLCCCAAGSTTSKYNLPQADWGEVAIEVEEGSGAAGSAQLGCTALGVKTTRALECHAGICNENLLPQATCTKLRQANVLW